MVGEGLKIHWEPVKHHTLLDLLFLIVFTTSYEIGVVISISQLKKLRFREIMEVAKV